MTSRKSSALILLALVPFFAGIRIGPAQTTAPDRAAALKVLDAYAATMDQIKKQGLSLTVEEDTVYEKKNWPDRNPSGMINGVQESHTLTESSWDGLRSYTHKRYWGKDSSGVETSKEEGLESFSLFDGKRSIGWSYLQPGKHTGQGAVLTASPKRPSVAEHSSLPPIPDMLGYPGYDKQSLDQVLRQATSLSLETTEASNPDGVVIQAKTSNGSYRVTFDPSHDYHYSRIEIQRILHDDLGPGRPTLGTASNTFVLDSVQFKKFGDLWMPIESHCVSNLVNLDPKGNPGASQQDDIRFHVTDLQLAPNFTVRRTFEPAFLPEGVTLRFDNGQQIPPVYQEVIWKQGRFTSAPSSPRGR
jgi:hypothetical protein